MSELSQQDQKLLAAIKSLEIEDVKALDNLLHKLRGGLVAPHGYIQLALIKKYGELPGPLEEALNKSKAALDEQVAKIGGLQERVRAHMDD